MVTISSYTQETNMNEVVGAAVSIMVVGMMLNMMKGMMSNAGPAYAKKHCLGKAGSQMSYIHTANRPWNASQGVLEVRPDCRAWLGDCSCVAIQMEHSSPWIAGKVEWSTRRILVEGGKDVELRQVGEPYHMVEITKREMDNIKWRQPIWAKSKETHFSDKDTEAYVKERIEEAIRKMHEAYGNSIDATEARWKIGNFMTDFNEALDEGYSKDRLVLYFNKLVEPMVNTAFKGG